MIPKIIHMCWLSGDPFPEDIQKCFDSWKKYLPDYEVWIWDTKRFDINSAMWTRQAFERKKYAFAADYIRLYALYNYGGIYLDSDVIVYKSFDDLLDLPYFIGQEQMGSLEPAIIGTEKENKWIGDVLNYYSNRSFIMKDGSLDTRPLPYVFYDLLGNKYRFYRLHKKILYKNEDDVINVFDKDFFNSRNRIGVRQTKKSYCSHAYAGSWMAPEKGMKARVRSIVPSFLLKLYLDVSHELWNRKAEHICEPVFQREIY